MTFAPDAGDYEGYLQSYAQRHFEELAEVSGRPILYNAVAANDMYPERHRSQLKWLESWTLCDVGLEALLAADSADPIIDAEGDRLTDPLDSGLPGGRREHVANLGFVRRHHKTLKRSGRTSKKIR